jgi:hypothetical protein
MTFRAKLLASTTLLGMVGLVSPGAQAGLLSANNLVRVEYYNYQTNSVSNVPEFELSPTNPGGVDTPVALSSPVTFAAGSASGTKVQVTDTQIILTNQVNGAYCFNGNVGAACTDFLQGFGIWISSTTPGTPPTILGVSVHDLLAAQAANYAPNSSGSHTGLQLTTAVDPEPVGNGETSDYIKIDLTGDNPANPAELVIDLSFQTPPPAPPPPPSPPPPAPAPEPASLVLLGSAVAGLSAVRRRRRDR